MACVQGQCTCHATRTPPRLDEGFADGENLPGGAAATALQASRKDAGVFCGSFLREGDVLAYVMQNQDLKDLEVMSLETGCCRRVRRVYRGTSPIRNSAPLGPYSRNMPRALWWS